MLFIGGLSLLSIFMLLTVCCDPEMLFVMKENCNEAKEIGPMILVTLRASFLEY